jgi:hypothetical protein
LPSTGSRPFGQRSLPFHQSDPWFTSGGVQPIVCVDERSYIFASLSDPLGLGWNLFGTAELAWQPMLTTILAPTQTLALVGGLVWSGRTAQKSAAQVRSSPVPVIAFCSAATLVMLWLLL